MALTTTDTQQVLEDYARELQAAIINQKFYMAESYAKELAKLLKAMNK